MTPATRRADEERIRAYLARRFPRYAGTIASGDPLERIVDSLGLFDLVEWLEGEFGIRVPNEEFSPRRFSSIDAILNTINEFRES